MNIGFHHYRKRKGRTNERGVKVILDRLIYVGAFLGPMGMLPQILKIWGEKNATGVSFLTWMATFLGAAFWIFYGFVHREKPVMFANVVMGFFALIIVAGILIYG